LTTTGRDSWSWLTVYLLAWLGAATCSVRGRCLRSTPHISGPLSH